MSFKPHIYDRLSTGDKIFEYRRQYSDEPTLVYMYVSSPLMKIKGRLDLGKRIDIKKWKEEYADNAEVQKRIDKYMTNYKYAMPVLFFQETTSISLRQLQKDFDKFVVPQSYYYLDNYAELLSYITKNIEVVGNKKMNDFTYALPNHICLQY